MYLFLYLQHKQKHVIIDNYYTSKHDSGDKYRVASLSIRVPSEKFSDVFEQISNLKNNLQKHFPVINTKLKF